ncbi:MAG: hypothetical protein GXP25_08895 [Planctomycetes bacterium]|nr:hypothetical protein [Planctomycetota bacterium]
MERSFFSTIIGVFWPPYAPVITDDELYSGSTWWGATCVLNVIPIAAVLHHAVIYYQRCMLQPFSYGYEVNWGVVYRWATHDAALPWAILLAIGVFRLGLRISHIKLAVAPVFISFLPISLWVWDIFFLNRPICRYLHDGKFVLWQGCPLRGRHLYVFGACIYVAFLIYLIQQRAKQRSLE